MADLQVLPVGDEEELLRPCADRGLITGNFCDTLLGLVGSRRRCAASGTADYRAISLTAAFQSDLDVHAVGDDHEHG